MHDTGRITMPLDSRARAIVFGDADAAGVRDDLPLYVQIDRAHIVMLVESRILARDRAQRLLEAIGDLARQDYAPLQGRAAIRGSYLLYEHWLVERLGEHDGGAVHIGRSRNDINATMLRLRLRPVYRRLIREVLRLIAVLCRRAQHYAHATMPAYTHYQPALPITYGYYLAGVGVALARDLQSIEDAAREIDRCPLGAGAAAGTTVPLDCPRTAYLLGFAEPVAHALDSVASRDVVLRLLSAASVLGITLSRLATDLQLWSTSEFDLIRFPDTLVGSSSMMPQKRNAFLLEHIKGRSGAPLGAFTAAAVAMHAAPFSNSVASGTEGVRPLWPAMTDLTEAVVLTRLMVDGAEPQFARMRSRAVEGFTCATELANRLVLGMNVSFRQAHHRVGEVVRSAVERGEPLFDCGRRLLQENVAIDPGGDAAEWLDPERIAARAAYGGGPAPHSMATVIADLRRRASASARELRRQSRRWQAAQCALDAAVARILRDGPLKHMQDEWCAGETPTAALRAKSAANPELRPGT